VHNIQKAADIVDFGRPFGVGISDFGPGKSYSFTFTKVGNAYSYVCTIHTGMSGHVQVETGTPPTTVP
jgi:plastocyanin